MAGRRGPKPRKIPERTCIGCLQVRPKKELMRIVRTPEGIIGLDPTGKRPGRGAYVCPHVDCVRKAARGHRLERALEHAVSPELLIRLEQDIVK